MTSKNIPIPKKLVLLGESSVGKTSLVLRYVNHFFDSRTEPTIGATYLTKTIDFPKYSLRLQIWDTAGQERYHSLAPLYYRGAHGALVVYDVENLDSWERAKEWVKELKSNGDPNILIDIIGNKTDLNIRVDPVEVASYCEENGFGFTETSAKTDSNVDEAFSNLAKKFKVDINENTITKKKEPLNLEKEEKKTSSGKCC
ncbi:ras-related protein rab-5c [Anaeramoeba flamelloides]|uniref:Ras-related protein rab-5c n=1 Tax=Anaeramoeba flamelloides TaxID=1746091 RepID=A0AAV7ZBL2_9EUKA|nr:ras-related protein rab-5c [Anaeramoeba flamelloides]